MGNNNTKLVIKLAGAAGQGIKTAGIIISKALKRSGYLTFGYTEYPSLIRGGHNVYQIEVFSDDTAALSLETDLLLALDQPSIKLHYKEIPKGGGIIYDENTITIAPELLTEINDLGIQLYPLKLLDIAKENGGNVLMKNTVALGALWKTMGFELDQVLPVLAETYNKTQEMIDLNRKCLEGGFNAVTNSGSYQTGLIPNEKFKNNIIITGNEAVAMGAIAAGVRLYSSYPMTPASSILTYLAEFGPKYGMIVKQAEDEITSANMVIGAVHGGTRAFCGTSGGGFDLMTEALSLAGIVEAPFVCVIGQRPGPATGVPTWTAQGDLNLALYAGHGDFPRIVLAPSDGEDAFYLTAEAFNLAERFQTPTLILTDKFMGESNYSVARYDQSKISIDRGKIITETAEAQDALLRYQFSEDGVSPRWFPGDNIATYLANSDEHTQKGYSTEDAEEVKAMMDKRSLKNDVIKKALPEPQIYGDPNNSQVNIVSWGSNRMVILAAIKELEKSGISCSFLHVTYLWPLKSETIKDFLSKGKATAIIEGNASGQLAKLIHTETNIEIKNKLLKYDGRPVYIEEVIEFIKNIK